MDVAVGAILKRVNHNVLAQVYELINEDSDMVVQFNQPEDLLHLVADKRHKMLKGGTPDITTTARILLQDWNSGRIPYFTVPPTPPVEVLESQVISTFSQEFDIDALLKGVGDMDDDGDLPEVRVEPDDGMIDAPSVLATKPIYGIDYSSRTAAKTKSSMLDE